MFGFLVLWVVVDRVGTFLRGPNWNFSALEQWDPHKNVPLNNVNLLIISGCCGRLRHGGMGWFGASAGHHLSWLLLLLPPLLAKTSCASSSARWASCGFFVLVTLIQFMAALPIKMVLRWTINLSTSCSSRNASSISRTIMAATDQPIANQRTLDMVFGVSSLLMLVSTILMFAQD